MGIEFIGVNFNDMVVGGYDKGEDGCYEALDC